MARKPIRLTIYQTAVPMKTFEHAAAKRDVAEAVVVRMDFDDGEAGWGETLPRPYVTGETIESVVSDLERVLWPQYRGRLLPVQPWPPPGRCINAAICAMDLAAFPGLDQFDRPDGLGISQAIDARVSGVLGSSDPSRTAKSLRKMRWFGLRDFKLKLGINDDADAANLRAVHDAIGKGIAAGKYTLRVDINGGWEKEWVAPRIAALRKYGVCVVEQPAYCTAAELVDLAQRSELPLMADESLLTVEDARTLLEEPAQIWWNIRVSKNGGLRGALALAALARQHDVPFTLGCMVGESGILSAAQCRLLQICPRPRFVEGNYGKFLLADDLTSPSPQMAYGGRLKALHGSGLGVQVLSRKLRKYGKVVKTLE